MQPGYIENLSDGYSLRVEHWRIADADPERQQVRVWLALDGQDLQYLTATVAATATDAEALAATRAACTAASEQHAEQAESEALLEGIVGGVV